MADWRTARFDPTYEEPIDPEILPLCDALNAAGVVTESSCCGHGYAWPYVSIQHSSDARLEHLARFVLQHTQGDFRPFFVRFQKEICLKGYTWSLTIHLNDLYADTPPAEGLEMAAQALATVTALVSQWSFPMLEEN